MAEGFWLFAICLFCMCFSATPMGVGVGRSFFPTAEAVGYVNAAAMRLSPAGVSRDVVRSVAMRLRWCDYVVSLL